MFENKVRPAVTNCKKYVPGKPIEEVKREMGITDVIKLASNENPFGCSPIAEQAMFDEIKTEISRYPESLCVNLVEKLSKKHNVDKNQIVVGNGLDNIITLIGMAFVDPGDEVVFAELTFPAYDNITAKMAGKSVTVPMTADERIDLNGLANAVTAKTKMVCVCNPNNPTGTYNTKDEVESFMTKIPKDVVVIFDEAYFEFADRKDFPDSFDLLKRYSNVIVLRTFSKVYGLASLRVGYSVSCPEIAEYLMKLREPFPVNRIASIGATTALDDQDFVKMTVENNEAGKRYIYDQLVSHGIKYYPTQTNFIYAELPKKAVDVFNGMLRDGVIIRPLAGQGRPYGIRITIGLPEENERMIKSLFKQLDS